MSEASVLDLKEIRRRSIDLIVTGGQTAQTIAGGTPESMGEMRDGAFVALVIPGGKRFVVYRIDASPATPGNEQDIAFYAGDASDPNRSIKFRQTVPGTDVTEGLHLEADPRVGIFSIEPQTPDPLGVATFQDENLRVAHQTDALNVFVRGYIDD